MHSITVAYFVLFLFLNGRYLGGDGGKRADFGSQQMGRDICLIPPLPPHTQHPPLSASQTRMSIGNSGQEEPTWMDTTLSPINCGS